MDLGREEHGGDQNEEQTGQQEDINAPVRNISGRARADGTAASTTAMATESDSSKRDGGSSSSCDEKEVDINLVEFHKMDRDQNGGDAYPDPPKKRETAVEDVDPSRKFQNEQFKEKGDEPSRLQEEMLGKESNQPEKVVETVPPTSRNETQALASRVEKNDHDSQLKETEKHVEDDISQSYGTAQKTEENVENGYGSSQVEIHGEDPYEKKASDMVNSQLKQERGNICAYKMVKTIDSFAGTETQIEYDSQLKEGRENGGNGMSQGDETLPKKEEIVKNTCGNPQVEIGGDQIDRCQKTDLNLVNSPSKRESENNGVYKIVKAIEGLQVRPKYIHSEIDHGLCQQKGVERSDGFKGILESVSEGTHGVACFLAESKSDMQKETGTSHYRDASTKSIEQSHVQEDSNIEEPLKDGSQSHFYLTGVEISEVKPIERQIDIEENVEAGNGKIKEINTGVTTVVNRESRLGSRMYTLSSYRTSVVYSKKDGLLLQGGSSSPQNPSDLTENFDNADISHPRLKIVHQFPRERKTGEEHHGGDHEASTSKSAEGESESEVEQILRLQQTHDLLCPNCGSCITKRVVLRKRKRTTAVSVDKWEQEVKDQENNVQFVEHAEGELPMEEYEETEDWGCLGCFTFLFRRVRGIRRRAGLATSEEARDVKFDSNCLPILFKWRRKAGSGILTPLLRHNESSEVTTRLREPLVEEAETAELREQLGTSLLGENVQIPVIVYESAMLEKTEDRICFPFSWSRATKTTKVAQALREPLLGQPQTADFTQVADKLTLPTEEVSMSVAPDGPSATSSSSVMVDFPDVFFEGDSSNPLVTVPLGEHDADCNCLPSFPWGPSGRTLDQKDPVKQEEQVRIVAVGDQAIRGEPRIVASKGSELPADARIKENEPVEATVVTVRSLHVPLSPAVESPSLPEVSIPLLSNEGSRASEVTHSVLTSSELEKAQDRLCLPLSWSRTTRITKDTREGRKEKVDSVSIPVEQTTVRRFERDDIDTLTRMIVSEVITLPQPHKGAAATAEGLIKKEVALPVKNMSTVPDAKQMKVAQREDSKCLPLSLPTLSWRRRQENKTDEYVEEMNLVDDATEKEDQSRLLREDAQILLQESSKNKLQETGQENEETGVLLSQDPHSTENYDMRTELKNDLGEEEPLVRKVHTRQLTKKKLDSLKQGNEAEYSIDTLAPKMNENENPSRLSEPNEGGQPVNEKLQDVKQEEEIEVTRIQDAYFTERHDMHTASMNDSAEEKLLLRKIRTQELTEDQVELLGQEPIPVEIEDNTHPESIDHAYFVGSLPVEQLPRKSEHAAQEIKEGDFPIGRSINYIEKEERNVPPQDSGTYYREGVREMGSWDCCLPAYSWRSTRALEAERPAEDTTVSKFMETSTLAKIQEAIEVVTEETTKPLSGQAEEKPQIEYLTSIADELLLPTEVVSRSTPSGPSEVSSSVVVDTSEVVAESGHSTPVVAAPVSERGAECNCLPTFSWGPSGRTRSQKDVVKQEKEVLINEVVEQAILAGPPVVASRERQLLANVGTNVEEPTEASVITVGSIDVPLSPPVESPLLSGNRVEDELVQETEPTKRRVIAVGSIDVPLSPTVKSPSLSGDRMEDEMLRAQTEPTLSAEQTPGISASIVIDTDGEVVATSSDLELGVNSELSEESGVDDAPRKAGLNCIGLCIPPYPWGPEAGTTGRDGPQEKLERNAVQIEQSTAGKFVSDTVTRTIPQPRKEVATAETSTEGLIRREVVLPVTKLSSVVDARQIKVIRTEDSKCLPLALPTFSWGRRSVKTVEYFEEKEIPSRFSEPSEGAPPLPRQKMEKLQGAEQEEDEVEALRSQDPQSTKQDGMDTELIAELTEEEPLVRKARMPATEDQIESERLDPVIVLAPKMNQKKKPRRLPESGEPLLKEKEYKKLEEVELEDAGVEVPGRQDPFSATCHFDMHPELINDLAEEELLVSNARMSKLREDPIEHLKQDEEGLVPFVRKASTRELTEDQVELLQQGPGEQEPMGLESKEEESSSGCLITQIEREEEHIAPYDVGTYYKEEVREMGSWDCCLPAYSWRSTRTLEAERPAETTIVTEFAEPSREVNAVTIEQSTIDARVTTTTRTYFKDSADKDHEKDVESVKIDTAVSFVKPSVQYDQGAIKGTLDEAMKGLSNERKDEMKRQEEASISEISRKIPQSVVPLKSQYLIWPRTSSSVGTEDIYLREPLLREEEKSGADLQESSVHVSIQQTHQVREANLPISQMPETDGRTVFTDEESIGEATCGCLPPRWNSRHADAAVPSVSVRERTSMDELQQPLLDQAEPEHYRPKGITIEEADITTTAVRVTTDNTVIEVQGGAAAETLQAATAAAEEVGMVAEAEVSQGYLKSIVYGGLEVSLTSLGVVASAAGGGANTRTVLALGLANLVFGVIAFYHKIVDLHRDLPVLFKMSVGQRFWLNSLLAILSFVVFGSLPPLTYGFSFRQSNDYDYKMAATVAVSVIAIVLLGCGKVAAKMTQQSYIKTLSTLIFTSVAASIAGFYTGDYASKLLEKFGYDAD